MTKQQKIIDEIKYHAIRILTELDKCHEWINNGIDLNINSDNLYEENLKTISSHTEHIGILVDIFKEERIK